MGTFEDAKAKQATELDRLADAVRARLGIEDVDGYPPAVSNVLLTQQIVIEAFENLPLGRG
jgi:hypothetical protein